MVVSDFLWQGRSALVYAVSREGVYAEYVRPRTRNLEPIVNELAAQNLINIVQIVDSRYRRKIDWLLQLHPSFDAIVNFGCHIGSETIALALLLNAKEVIGLDKEPDSIMQANDQVKTIWEDIESVRRDLYYESGQDKGDRGALQSLLQSFAGKVAPTFVEADVLVVAKLLENHFDLVYCESFLYHFTSYKLAGLTPKGGILFGGSSPQGKHVWTKRFWYIGLLKAPEAMVC